MRKFIAQTGGKSVWLDDLDNIQNFRIEAEYHLNYVNTTDPIVINGCWIIPGVSSTTMTPGIIQWLHPDEEVPRFFRFPGGTVTVTGETNISIAYVVDELQYVDYQDSTPGSAPSVKDEFLMMQAGTIGSSVGFNLPALKYRNGDYQIGDLRHVAMSNADVSAYFVSGLGINKWTAWAIADGNNGTIDMQGRTLIGFGTESQSATVFANGSAGGEVKHLMTANELVRHVHDVNYGVATPPPTTPIAPTSNRIAINDDDANNYGISKVVTAQNTSTQQAFNIMQPYHTVVILQKIR